MGGKMSAKDRKNIANDIVKHGEADYFGLPELKNKDADISIRKRDKKLVVTRQGDVSYFLDDFYKVRK